MANINGTDDGEFIDGTAEDDVISGKAGNDTIDAADGDDVVFGGLGRDQIEGEDGNDTLYGDDGGTTGPNLILNGSFEDATGVQTTGYGGVGFGSIIGWTETNGDEIDLHSTSTRGVPPADGSTWLDLGASPGNTNVFQDIPDLGEGEIFVLRFAAGDTKNTDNELEVYWGGELIERIDPPEGSMDEYSFLVVGGAGDGSDRLEFRGLGPVDNFGASLDDVRLHAVGGALTGDSDTIRGGDDDDIIIGEAGDDKLYGDDGSDTMSGGVGQDQIFGDEGDDLLRGGDDGDRLKGGDGNDVLFGDDGDDRVEGSDGQDTLTGGAGDDTLLGGADQDRIFGGAGDSVDGGSTGIDFDTLDLTGAGDFRIIFSPTNNEDGRVEFLDAGGGVTGSLDFKDIESIVPCFTLGAQIATPLGERAIESLREGDKVLTRDNGPQEIRWIGRKRVSHADLVSHPEMCPIFLPAGCLGPGQPARDMMVSPNHRMLICSPRAGLHFADHEVLAAAKHLLHSGAQELARPVTYVHIMFDQHEVVLSDGAWSESFQPGDLSMGGIDGAQRQELLALFPELATAGGREEYIAARRSLKRHEAEILFR